LYINNHSHKLHDKEKGKKDCYILAFILCNILLV
jgi:hypothetical protein